MEMWNNISIFDCLMAGSLLIMAIYVYLTWDFDYFAKRNIPFKKPIPLFGNAAGAAFGNKSFMDFLTDIFNRFKDRSIVGVFMFSKPVFFIRDPDLIKLITVKDFDHFTDHVEQFPDDVEPLHSSNLESLRGEKWRKMKSILSPAFTISKLKGMVPLISQCAQQLLHHLDTRFEDTGKSTLETDMKDLFTRYTNDVIATTAFGISCDSFKNPKNEFYLCGKDITMGSGIRYVLGMAFFLFPRLMAWLRVRVISKASSDFLYSAVSETFKVRKKEGIVRHDMIQLLMQTREDITCRDITAQVMIFLFAGFEMPSTMLSFTSVLLATHQDVQERLREEIDQALEDCGGQLTCEVIRDMKYLDMVVSESLRMYPPAVVTDRMCVKPYTLAATENSPEVKFEIGDKIFIPIYTIHRDPAYYSDPEKFDPERFSDGNKHSVNPYTYLPFGVGPRSCIGFRFALMLVKIAIIYLLSRYSFEVIEKSPVPMKYRKHVFNFEPENGFWIGITNRNKREGS